jgi:hypothetical protein
MGRHFNGRAGSRAGAVDGEGTRIPVKLPEITFKKTLKYRIYPIPIFIHGVSVLYILKC